MTVWSECYNHERFNELRLLKVLKNSFFSFFALIADALHRLLENCTKNNREEKFLDAIMNVHQTSIRSVESHPTPDLRGKTRQMTQKHISTRKAVVCNAIKEMLTDQFILLVI